MAKFIDKINLRTALEGIKAYVESKIDEVKQSLIDVEYVVSKAINDLSRKIDEKGQDMLDNFNVGKKIVFLAEATYDAKEDVVYMGADCVYDEDSDTVTFNK